MAAVDKAKQLKAKCAEQEAALSDAAKVREELGRVQQQLGALHGTCSALKSQLKAAKEQREEAGSAREHLLAAQVGGAGRSRACMHLSASVGGWHGESVYVPSAGR